MAESNQNRLVFNGLVVSVVALIVLFVGLPIYQEKRGELVTERDSKVNAVKDEKLTLQKEVKFREFMKGPGETMKLDAGSVQDQLLHLVHDWESQTGVSGVSFQRTSTLNDHGFTRLIFQITATGTMRSMAGLVYRIETSAIPLRIDNARLTPKAEAGDPLQISLTFSALCKGTGPKALPQPVSDGELAGGL